MCAVRTVVVRVEEADRHPGAQPGACVAVSVSDTGQGMDSATAAQVFEPFYTTKAEGGGGSAWESNPRPSQLSY